MVDKELANQSSKKATGAASEYVIKKLNEEHEQAKAKPQVNQPKSI